VTRAALHRRLASLTAAIRPAKSVAARVAALPVKDQQRYHGWRAACAEHYAAHPDGEAYSLSLAGDHGPWLPGHIKIAVFGVAKDIPADATVEEAATIYQRFMENGSNERLR
jgi:hypothetical protein